MTIEVHENDPIFINEAEVDERLDKVLARRFKETYSRSYFQMLISEHKVLLNGTPIKKREKAKIGDEIEIEFILTPEIDIKPEAIPLEIVYEDNDLLVINKPVGMVVHPAVGNWSGTFANALLFHCQKNSLDISSLRPGIVHRLDKDTSGLLMAAKNPLAQQRLIELFSSRKIYKEYIAICLGNPGNREIKAPIGRHPIQRKKMTVLDAGGKEALSICETLATDGKISITKVILATGRTHQIRVHLKHLGTPVLGDSLYGNTSANKKYEVTTQLLHAHILKFIHPIKGIELSLVAPLPTRMQAFADRLKKHTRFS